MKKLFFIIPALIIFYGCPAYDPSQEMINIHNNTDSAIYVYHSCSDTLPRAPALRLFEILNNNATDAKGKMKKGEFYSPDYRINAYSYGVIGIPANKSSLKECCDGKMRFFFIKEKTMREKTWEEIYKNQLYDKKIALTKEDLKKCNWIVTYP